MATDVAMEVIEHISCHRVARMKVWSGFPRLPEVGCEGGEGGPGVSLVQISSKYNLMVAAAPADNFLYVAPCSALLEKAYELEDEETDAMLSVRQDKYDFVRLVSLEKLFGAQHAHPLTLLLSPNEEWLLVASERMSALFACSDLLRSPAASPKTKTIHSRDLRGVAWSLSSRLATVTTTRLVVRSMLAVGAEEVKTVKVKLPGGGLCVDWDTDNRHIYVGREGSLLSIVDVESLEVVRDVTPYVADEDEEDVGNICSVRCLDHGVLVLGYDGEDRSCLLVRLSADLSAVVETTNISTNFFHDTDLPWPTGFSVCVDAAATKTAYVASQTAEAVAFVSNVAGKWTGLEFDDPALQPMASFVRGDTVADDEVEEEEDEDVTTASVLGLALSLNRVPGTDVKPLPHLFMLTSDGMLECWAVNNEKETVELTTGTALRQVDSPAFPEEDEGPFAVPAASKPATSVFGTPPGDAVVKAEETPKASAFSFGAPPGAVEGSKKSSAFSFGKPPGSSTGEPSASPFGKAPVADASASPFGKPPGADPTEKPAFSFGAPPGAKAEDSKSSAFSFGKPPAAAPFASPFGKPPAADPTASPFGKPPAADPTASPFGKPPGDAVGAAAKEDKPAFSFGAPPGAKAEASKSSAFSFGKPPAADPNASPFGKPPGADPTASPFGKPLGEAKSAVLALTDGSESAKEEKSAFSFGAPPGAEGGDTKAKPLALTDGSEVGSEDTKPAFSFGAPPGTKAEASKSSAFSFGKPPAADPTASPFGKPPGEAKPAVLAVTDGSESAKEEKSAFSFGAPPGAKGGETQAKPLALTDGSEGAKDDKPAFSFGAPPGAKTADTKAKPLALTDGSEVGSEDVKPAFSFGAPPGVKKEAGEKTSAFSFGKPPGSSPTASPFGKPPGGNSTVEGGAKKPSGESAFSPSPSSAFSSPFGKPPGSTPAKESSLPKPEKSAFSFGAPPAAAKSTSAATPQSRKGDVSPSRRALTTGSAQLPTLSSDAARASFSSRTETKSSLPAFPGKETASGSIPAQPASSMPSTRSSPKAPMDSKRPKARAPALEDPLQQWALDIWNSEVDGFDEELRRVEQLSRDMDDRIALAKAKNAAKIEVLLDSVGQLFATMQASRSKLSGLHSQTHTLAERFVEEAFALYKHAEALLNSNEKVAKVPPVSLEPAAAESRSVLAGKTSAILKQLQELHTLLGHMKKMQAQGLGDTKRRKQHTVQEIYAVMFHLHNSIQALAVKMGDLEGKLRKWLRRSSQRKASTFSGSFSPYSPSVAGAGKTSRSRLGSIQKSLQDQLAASPRLTPKSAKKKSGVFALRQSQKLRTDVNVSGLERAKPDSFAPTTVATLSQSPATPKAVPSPSIGYTSPTLFAKDLSSSGSGLAAPKALFSPLDEPAGDVIPSRKFSFPSTSSPKPASPTFPSAALKKQADRQAEGSQLAVPGTKVAKARSTSAMPPMEKTTPQRRGALFASSSALPNQAAAFSSTASGAFSFASINAAEPSDASGLRKSAFSGWGSAVEAEEEAEALRAKSDTFSLGSSESAVPPPSKSSSTGKLPVPSFGVTSSDSTAAIVQTVGSDSDSDEDTESESAADEDSNTSSESSESDGEQSKIRTSISDSSESATSSFSFGAPPTDKKDSSSAFSFGAPPTEKKKDSSSAFSFGAPPGETKEAATPAKSAFSFGAPPGASPAKEESKTSAFSFGAPPESKTSAFGAPSGSAVTPSAENTPVAATSALGSFSFGVAASPRDSKSESLFAPPSPKPSAGSSAFGAPATSPSSGGGLFSAPAAGASSAFAAVTSIGSGSSPSAFGSVGKKRGDSVFGSSQASPSNPAASPFGASQQPAPAFGASSSSAFGAPAASPAASPFGAAAPQASAFGTSGTSAFGAAAPSPAASPFGSSAPSPSASPFGSGSSASFGSRVAGATGTNSTFGQQSNLGFGATPGFGTPNAAAMTSAAATGASAPLFGSAQTQTTSFTSFAAAAATNPASSPFGSAPQPAAGFTPPSSGGSMWAPRK